MSSAELNQHHERCRASALLSFNSAKKMGGPELTSQFREKLEEDIKSANEAFIRVNNSKNLFKSVKTPAVLVSLMVINYIFQEFFQLLGLNMLASVFSLILTIVIALLITWTYSRYSGHLRDAQKSIDTAVNFVHGNFILPAFATAVGNATLDIAMGSNSTLSSSIPTNVTSSTSTEDKKKK
jgi:atlastin